MAGKAGRGSIVQLDKGKDGRKPKAKCRKWRLVVSLGRDPQTGKYPQKSRTFTGSYSDATTALAAFVAEIEGGSVVQKNTWTFNEYAEHYLEARKAAGEHTAKSLSSTRKNLGSLGFLIGHMKLQEITPRVIEAACIDLRNGKSPSGKKLSGTTVHSYCVSASGMFDHAKKARLVASNPFKDCQIPKKDTKEKTAMNAESYMNLLDKLDPQDGYQIAILLCATLGLRRGEACGLSWGDVDFEENTVFVRHSYDDFGNLKAPKTEAGVRLLPLPPFTRDALQKRKAAQLAMVPESGSEGYTRKKEDGTLDLVETLPIAADEFVDRIVPQSLSGWWTYRRQKFGADRISLHQLRHTFLSLAAEQGVHPSVMQKLAGHASPLITMKIYTHVNVEAKKAAMDALQSAYMQRDAKAC